MQLHPVLALIAVCGGLAAPATAQEVVLLDGPALEEAWLAEPLRIFSATEVDLDDLQWIARPVIVFANSPRDPAYLQQMEEILAEGDRLAERDVIVIIDTDRDSGSEIRTRLRPRGFMLTLIGKDGEVKLRKPLPWTVRELSRSIDKMPMRQREEREGRDGRIDG